MACCAPVLNLTQTTRLRGPMNDPYSANHSRLLKRRLAELPEVRLAYLFGSCATGLPRPDSDLDIAVLVDDGAAAGPGEVNRTIRRLAGRLGGDIPSEGLDIVLLNTAPALLRHRVLRDGLLLHARSETERVRFALCAIRDYQDMESRLAEHRRQRIARLKKGRTRGRSGDILQAARRA